MVFTKKIEVADFGCEGVPDNVVIRDKVTFVIGGKENIVEIKESLLWELKIDEGMSISEEVYEKIIKLNHY